MEFKIYVDMDGVLTAWDQAFMNIADGLTVKEYDLKYGEGKADELIYNAGSQFWYNMGWLSNGEYLWIAIIHMFDDVNILSATGGKSYTNMARFGKLKWLHKNISNLHQNNIYIVETGLSKATYANSNSILIDDQLKNIEAWENNGGIGILHKNNADTIKQLKKYMDMDNTTDLIIVPGFGQITYNQVLNEIKRNLNDATKALNDKNYKLLHSLIVNGNLYSLVVALNNKFKDDQKANTTGTKIKYNEPNKNNENLIKTSDLKKILQEITEIALSEIEQNNEVIGAGGVEVWGIKLKKGNKEEWIKKGKDGKLLTFKNKYEAENKANELQMDSEMTSGYTYTAAMLDLNETKKKIILGKKENLDEIDITPESSQEDLQLELDEIQNKINELDQLKSSIEIILSQIKSGDKEVEKRLKIIEDYMSRYNLKEIISKSKTWIISLKEKIKYKVVRADYKELFEKVMTKINDSTKRVINDILNAQLEAKKIEKVKYVDITKNPNQNISESNIPNTEPLLNTAKKYITDVNDLIKSLNLLPALLNKI